MCTFVQLIYLFNLKFNKMKKLLVVLAAAGLLFAMSSCAKKCTCTTYMLGEVDSVEEIEVGMGKDHKNCADLQKYFDDSHAGYDESIKSGIKCE